MNSCPIADGLWSEELADPDPRMSALDYDAYKELEVSLPNVPAARLKREWKRGLWAFILYAVASAVAFVWVYAALVILVIIPFLFFVPRLLRKEQ